jgi:hypothetical protein
MKAIEVETVISPEGKLPASLSEAFGRKVRVIVLFPEDTPEPQPAVSPAQRLMELAGKIQAFQSVDDPVQYQRQIRSEWSE